MNGLDDLTARRNKATKGRTLPPPKHPARATPVELQAPDVDTTPTPDPTPRPVREPEPIAPAASTPPTIAASPIEPAARAGAGERDASVAEADPAPIAGPEDSLSRATVYLDEVTDNFIEGIIAAGRARRPRVSISRSAVVRLALTELAKSMTVAAAAEELASKGSGNSPGRPRL